MSTTTHDDDQPGFFDFMLNEPLRFPTEEFGWRNFNTTALVCEPELNRPAHDYAKIVGRKPPAITASQTVKLMDLYPRDFDEADEEITPEAWRFLFYAGTYSQEMLAHFRFHPGSELIRLSLPTGEGIDIPREFIGTEETPITVATQIHGLLQEKGPEVAKAIWTVLALAQRLNLTKSEVLRCQWWSPLWIRALNDRLNSGS
jgi:hypothetical protein